MAKLNSEKRKNYGVMDKKKHLVELASDCRPFFAASPSIRVFETDINYYINCAKKRIRD